MVADSHRDIIQSLEDDKDLVVLRLQQFSTRTERTRFITGYIAKHLRNVFGLQVSFEKRLENYKRKNSKNGGILDIRAFRPDLKDVTKQIYTLDIEIDSGDKKNSLRKLIHSKESLGHHVLWIRHGSVRVSSISAELIAEHKIKMIAYRL